MMKVVLEASSSNEYCDRGCEFALVDRGFRAFNRGRTGLPWTLEALNGRNPVWLLHSGGVGCISLWRDRVEIGNSG